MHQAEKILLALTIAIIIVSCTSKSNKEKDVLNQIEKAWVLSDDNIDSAITLSDSLRNAVYTSSEYARMKFDLLNIRIRYKKRHACFVNRLHKESEQLYGGTWNRDRQNARILLYGLHICRFARQPQSCRIYLESFIIYRRPLVMRHLYSTKILFSAVQHIQDTAQLPGSNKNCAFGA
mgnify:CR=1 FL=1